MSTAQQNDTPTRRRRKPEAAAEPTPLARPARSRRIEVEGRDGVVLSRKRTGNTDPYAIPPHIIPDGWDYQWNTYTVAGEKAVDSQILMAENGWRPVPAERHPGMFMPEGHKGLILRGGMQLDERPMALTLEARVEDQRVAAQQLRDQSAQFGIGNKLARGFDERRFLPGGQGVRTGIDAAVDVPRARYEIDPNS